MKNMFIVHWGSASQDDDGNSKAYCGIHGVYPDIKSAQKALVECKDLMYDETIQSEDPEELEYRKSSTKVYGSVEEGYFEIDYDFADIPNELYITITMQ
jgi:hypothetical protein